MATELCHIPYLCTCEDTLTSTNSVPVAAIELYFTNITLHFVYLLTGKHENVFKNKRLYNNDYRIIIVHFVKFIAF